MGKSAISYIVFYEDLPCNKDESSIIGFLDDAGYFIQSSGGIDYVSYKFDGGLMIEQQVRDNKGVRVVSVYVSFSPRSKESFLNYKGDNYGN